METLKNALVGAVIFPAFVLAVALGCFILFGLGAMVTMMLSGNEVASFVVGCVTLAMGLGAFYGTQHQ